MTSYQRCPDQRAYWDGEGAAKTFTHPLPASWLDDADRAATALDHGCGYGRLTAELVGLGFTDVVGTDVSEPMLARARASVPTARFVRLTDHDRLPVENGSVGTALLAAVLTCIPSDDQQRSLAAALVRALAPGGLLLVSDLELQESELDRERYAAGERAFGTYGIFRSSDGAVFRHHEPGHLEQLFAGLEVRERRQVDIATMNGRPVRATQLLLQRPLAP